MPANLIVRFPLGLYMLAKKVHVTRSFTTRVFRIAHGHLSRRNNGNKRPGVQVFQVMLCTMWCDAFVRPWISDPNETMMSCLAWKGCCEANNWEQYVKNLLCRTFVTFHNKLQRSISVYLESYIIHGIPVGVFGALTPLGTSGTSSASSLRENDQVVSHERRKAQEIWPRESASWEGVPCNPLRYLPGA